MSKKFIYIFIFFTFFLILLVWFFFNQNNSNLKQEIIKPKIAVTIFPLYDIAKQIGGDKIDTILVLPPGSSPHTYEASPTQIKDMQGAKYFFTIGVGIDDWAQNISNAVDGVEIIDISKSISLKKIKGQTEYDPHYWLSPLNAKIIARVITENLNKLDSLNSNYYETNYQNFINLLDAKDTEWKKLINQLNKKDIVVLHDAWGYLSEYLDLKIVASFEPFPGKTPGPQYIIDLQNTIKEYNINTLFVEPQLSTTAITTLGKDLNVKISTLDPIGGIEQRKNYIDLINYNIQNIYEALK